MEEKEVWKDINGYDGIYKVSYYGNVVRFKAKRWVKVKPWKDLRGYLHISLSKDGIRKVQMIHRIVAKSFLANPNNYICVNHIDEDKSNNNVSNLEWCTYKMNDNHGTRNERISKSAEFCHLQYNYSKFDKSGNLLKKYTSVRQIEIEGYNIRSIRTSIRNNGTYKGFYWKKELIKNQAK